MLNKDIKTRDTLIFGKFEPDKYAGGIRRFENVSFEVLDRLITEKFCDPNDCQNCAPSIRLIHGFMEKHPGYAAHGYAVELPRKDYRVSIEGVTKDTGYASVKELEDFVNLFHDADDFEAGPEGMYCWFD